MRSLVCEWIKIAFQLEEIKIFKCIYIKIEYVWKFFQVMDKNLY